MISAINKTQDKETETPLNECDKMLSDEYILRKEIRDLNKTLEDSTDTLNMLEADLKNKILLKEQLAQFINSMDKIQNDPDLAATNHSALNKLIEKFNTEQNLQNLPETLTIEKSGSGRVRQLLMDKSLALIQEIKELHEKTESRKKVNTEVCVERDSMKAQLKNILDEMADNTIKEE